MDLISVIVPIYNVEQYLDKCIESIVKQTYTNLEIILVDDGSPDNCPVMCDEWAKKDARIKVIHKENGGLSDARNAGLMIATGEYIAFVDSDDWVHKSYINDLYSAALRHDADIVACDVAFVTERDIRDEFQDYLKESCYSSEEALNTLIQGNGFRAVAWNKLYKKRILASEGFEVGRYHEDEFFTYRILAKTERLVFIDTKLYYYYQRDNSIINSISEKHLDALDAYIERLKFFKESYPAVYKKDIPGFCIACINSYVSIKQLNKERYSACQHRIKNVRSKLKVSLSELFTYSIKDAIYIAGSNRLFLPFFSNILSIKRSQ